jgi:hypothetical protein
LNDNSDTEKEAYRKSWRGLLAAIRKRPAMFLGCKSLQRFDLFKQGFTFAESIHEIPNPRRHKFNDFPWQEFEDYVLSHHNERRLSLRSFSLAQYVANGKNLDTFKFGNEYPGAWEIWWNWFDEFDQAKKDEPKERN